MDDVKRIIFRCPDDVFKRLDVEAKRQGVDRTSFIVRAIVRAVDECEYERNNPRRVVDYNDLLKRIEMLEKASSAKPKSLS